MHLLTNQLLVYNTARVILVPWPEVNVWFDDPNSEMITEKMEESHFVLCSIIWLIFSFSSGLEPQNISKRYFALDKWK